MERFDDVELRLIEEEDPPPRAPRRRARWGLAVVASVLTAGALAAGASALTSSGGDHARPAAKPRFHQIHRHVAGVPCHHPDAGASLSTAPRD